MKERIRVNSNYVLFVVYTSCLRHSQRAPLSTLFPGSSFWNKFSFLSAPDGSCTSLTVGLSGRVSRSFACCGGDAFLSRQVCDCVYLFNLFFFSILFFCLHRYHHQTNSLVQDNYNRIKVYLNFFSRSISSPVQVDTILSSSFFCATTRSAKHGKTVCAR
jgi:hypothetical protein